MKYIVLLRGINISGKNKIDMKNLKIETENLGYHNVITYLNSGNLIFTSDIKDKSIISNSIYNMIKDKFNLDILVYITTYEELKELLDNSPSFWNTGNKEIYDNIIFIIEPYTYKEVYNGLGEPNHSLEQIKEYKNKIFWSYDLKNYRKSTWWVRSASTDIKDYITIRTANTVNKLLEICEKM